MRAVEWRRAIDITASWRNLIVSGGACRAPRHSGTEVSGSMPVYDYFCEANGRTVEVAHSIDAALRYWGEVCYVAQIPLGDTNPLAPVRRVITKAPAVATSPSDAELKGLGFTKLVRREEGVFENVTATDDEKRFVRADDPASLPRLNRKMKD